MSDEIDTVRGVCVRCRRHSRQRSAPHSQARFSQLGRPGLGWQWRSIMMLAVWSVQTMHLVLRSAGRSRFLCALR